MTACLVVQKTRPGRVFGVCKDVTCLRTLTQDSYMLPARMPSTGTYSSVTVVRTLERGLFLGKDGEPSTEYRKGRRHFLNEFFWQEVNMCVWARQQHDDTLTNGEEDTFF